MAQSQRDRVGVITFDSEIVAHVPPSAKHFNAMLHTLDPHSNFFDPKEYQSLRDDQKGHYYGVGMTVGPRNGKTMVMAPFPGSPAYKAGIRAGDHILEIDDSEVPGVRYLTKEERALKEEEERKAREREEALKGDNVQQRGLKSMLGGNELNLKKDKNKAEETMEMEDWMHKPQE